MSVFDQLSLEERARHLRNPSGELGIAVTDALSSINRTGNARTVVDLHLIEDDRVLEIGCGLSTMAAIVTAAANRVRYVGVDHSVTMIDTARERHAALISAGKAVFYLAEAENMPFDDECFSKVFSVGVMHFWPDPARTLAEVLRVMRRGAILIMGGLGPERAPPFAQEDLGFQLHGVDRWRLFAEAAGLEVSVARTFDADAADSPQIIRIEARRPLS